MFSYHLEYSCKEGILPKTTKYTDVSDELFFKKLSDFYFKVLITVSWCKTLLEEGLDFYKAFFGLFPHGVLVMAGGQVLCTHDNSSSCLNLVQFVKLVIKHFTHKKT